MTVICVIPARYGSTRFEGKPLVEICGKSMIQRVYDETRKAKLVDEVYIATDDARIRHKSETFGAKVFMTSRHHASGTDRIAEAIQDLDDDIIVNAQGDEPLIEPEALDTLIVSMIQEPDITMATLITPITDESEYQDPNVVKVVKDKNNFALYFSRALLPYPMEGRITTVFKQLGIYAYRRDFLLTFSKLEPTTYEKQERLEQLRALENNYKIKLIETGYNPISVDVPEDVAKVENILRQRENRA